MRSLKQFWRSTFDVREGERLRTLFMSLYLFFVLVVHYIQKPLSEGLFVDQFDIDKIPRLTILTAVGGGLLMSIYTRVAMRTSLQTAVSWVMGLSVSCILAFWWLVRTPWNWVLYAFSVWAAMFGVVVVAQGYVVAANVFTSREAKRLYGLLGLGAAAGSLIGAAFVAVLVERVGYRGLLLISAPLIGFAYLSFRLLIAQRQLSLRAAKGVEPEEERVSVREMLTTGAQNQHLRLITVIITFVFLVDELVKFQWKAAAKGTYQGEALSSFFGEVYIYTNVITFLLQFVLTGTLVTRFGIGSTLKLMPASITLASIGSLFQPGVLSATVTRLIEGASRYSFNKTGMELLYLPLPSGLRNRTKAFMDVFMDRAARGLAGMLLIVLGWVGLQNLRALPWIVIGFAIAWLLLSRKAQEQYILTIRKRLDARRLDLETARVAVTDPAMVAFLEQAARSANPRQACYALSVLADASGYNVEPLLRELVGSPLPEVRAAVFDLARQSKSPALLEAALDEARSGKSPAVKSAARCALALSPDSIELAKEFLSCANPLVVEGALDILPSLSEAACDLVARDWLSNNAAHPDPARRSLAALAVTVCGDRGTETVHRLLQDSDPMVAASACRAAGKLKNRAYLHAIISRLADPRVRGAAIEALAAYGVRISGTLGDLLEDRTVPTATRRQIARVLRLIPDQRSVDILLRSINDPNLAVRAAVLKALNRLRETAPALDYGKPVVAKQILEEARVYYQLHAALAPLRGYKNRCTATGLLAASLEERLKQTLERLFRLLGLRYPPKEIYAAYLAVHHRAHDRSTAGLDFLENVLDREFKHILLPLLEDSVHLAERARDLFGVDIQTPEDAVRRVIHSGDPWLTACAIAAAAELKLHRLAPDIAQAARDAGIEVSHVARAAGVALS